MRERMLFTRYRVVNEMTRRLLNEFAAALPKELAAGLPGDWRNPDAVLTPKPYTPLAASLFGIQDRRMIAEAAAASLMMELYCCLQDARIDGHPVLAGWVSEALGNVLLIESLTRFERVAGDAAGLRPYVQRAFVELAEGYAEEQRPGGEQDHFRSVTNRAAPFHILIAALGLHAGQRERIAECSQLARHLLFWFQIQDDLQDWREDLAAGRRSYLLSRLDGARTEAEAADALYLFGGLERLIDEAVHHLEAAQGMASASRALRRLIGMALEHHGELRAWCIGRKRALLAAAA